MSHYLSHGKFLLTGEYLVLKGALALTVPLKLGQSLDISLADTDTHRLHWTAQKPDSNWFSASFDTETLQPVSTNDPEKTQKLASILKAVRQLKPSAFLGGDLRIRTRLDFDPEWGLGSSSTLIANLAQWTHVDPYALLKLTFGGSGYDIACATATQPIHYKLPEPVEGATTRPMIEPVDFNPPFADHLFFVYQGQKQSSSKEVKAFLEKTNPVDLQKDIESVSEISRSMLKCESLDEFGMLMQCHERIVSRCIGQEPVQKRFPDFGGTLKSLGAWGGDFIIAATEWPENQVRTYFQSRGLDIIFPYRDIIFP